MGKVGQNIGISRSTLFIGTYHKIESRHNKYFLLHIIGLYLLNSLPIYPFPLLFTNTALNFNSDFKAYKINYVDIEPR